MWAEYFPFARIVGLDIARKEMSLSPRVKIIQGSQVDFGLLQRIIDDHGPFDLVIDDGSHHVEHVLATFKFIFPRLPGAALYIVEDTQTSFHRGAGGSPDGQGTIFTLAHAITLAMHKREGYDISLAEADLAGFCDITAAVTAYRNLFVFERGDNNYPSIFFGLNLSHPQVKTVYDAMEKEATDNPSSRGALSRIDLAIWGGDKKRAADLAVLAVNANPMDVELLSELLRMMEWAGLTTVADTLRARLARLAGGG
jgi:hypothetical protein